MLLEYNLRFDEAMGEYGEFVSENLRLDGKRYQSGNDEIDKKVQENVEREKEKTSRKLYSAWIKAVIPFIDFCRSVDWKLRNYSIMNII